MYEPPVIQPITAAPTNKFGAAPADPNRRLRERIDGVGVEALLADHGSPCFVFSERRLRERVRRVREAFCGRYEDVAFGWSYKTNYLPAICSIMHQEGSLAEVVSLMEYEMARRLGVPGEQIIVNGPLKERSFLARAIDEGAQIHIDHNDELADLEALARERGRVIPVGIRINLDCGIHPQWSRFGFNLENGQAWEAIRRMHAGGHLRLTGLHCHIGTYICDPEAYAQQIAKLCHLAAEIEDRYGWPCGYLDIGGGLPSRARLKGSYLPPDLALPPVEHYAECVCNALHANLRPGMRPRLILESGRGLVDEAGYLLTSVRARKRLADGTQAYVLDAGVNLLYTSTWYKHQVELGRPVSGPNEHSVLYGPLCMNIDVVDDGLPLPPLPRDTPLVLSPVGAYNVTQSMQFIRYRPAVVLIDENGNAHRIREAEDCDAVCAGDHLPTHLSLHQAPADHR